MVDVARLAGVSHMTVSRVINDQPTVSQVTRQRVLAAMNELGYRPNIAARALVTGRTRTLGVISIDTTLYGPASMLLAIERAARDIGYAISIASLPSVDRRSFGDAFEALMAQAVEGIIAITPHVATTAALRHVPKDVPVVAVEGGKGPLPTVAVDQQHGARLATAHLLSLGHRTVAHIAGPIDWHEAQERERGWRDVLLAEEREVPDVVRGDWSPRSGYVAARSLLDRPDLTAVFVANDQMAIGALRAFGEAGVDVPRQVSVVGFDDIPEAEFFSPPLTTLRQEFGEVGRQSLDLLMEQVDGAPRTRRRVVIPPEFVIRDSTQAPE
ncbi:LacI family transcriptional regulator [Phytohabitans rumicis]|uniref:LacI family transcriptional regulator n=2 Tax=Phytohabitans rumicis TaxID=1076125 RepID=A0A6V8KZT8_9ACTN|nr:LacI family transcriptional regulator [Phytohabitans rumicis]